jgi:predicted CXXCH cytochrome family protein
MVGKNGVESEFAAVRAIGVDPLVQYLVRGDRGRLQVGQSAWDPTKREWFDVFADGRGPGEWGHWTGAAMTWNSQCAWCHATGVVKGWTESTDTYATTFESLGVTCEACHGDQAPHLAGGPAPKLDSRQVDAVCASCHSRRAELTGTFHAGAAFLDHFAPRIVDATDAYWPDGQVREEDFESVAFLGSRMHAAGVRCSSCHDPHSGDTRADGDALCLGCHGLMTSFTAHDLHPDPVGCAACHLPQTTYMQRHARHDHSFQIPDPWLEVHDGIPSACSKCHADDGAPAMLAAAERWWGDPDGPRRHRAHTLARLKAGDEGSVPDGLALVRSDPAPVWRATTAGLLVGFLDRADVQAGVIAALADPDPLVRFAAADTADGRTPELEAALVPLLGDPVRAVRVAASRALHDRLSPDDPRAADYATYLAYNADQPAALAERGSWMFLHGRLDRAVADFRRAAALDPTSPAHHDALAVALDAHGRPVEAAASLRRAVALAPTDPELQFRLGLAEAGAGNYPAADAALSEALRLDPTHAGAKRNLEALRAVRR